MRANRSDNALEREFRRAIRGAGIGGYRLWVPDLPGRPDVSFPRRRLAVFVNGCFWHRCPTCGPPTPRTRRAFWEAKFRRNVERDAGNAEALRAAGWDVLVIWEHDVRPDPAPAVAAVLEALGRR